MFYKHTVIDLGTKVFITVSSFITYGHKIFNLNTYTHNRRWMKVKMSILPQKKQKNKLPYLENQATGVTVFLLAVIL